MFEITTTTGETVATEQFDIEDQSVEYTHKLTCKEVYQFSVALESGPTGTDELAVFGDTALQIDLYPDEVQFKTLTVPGP
ncbi:hypothetical protein ACH9L7_11060 [Haloferax sp. S1W]|uniref:hypothetical protein n=1 Tax=Haloferax sp. S1W TaxID=3377110 RepID=UPI0037C87724